MSMSRRWYTSAAAMAIAWVLSGNTIHAQQAAGMAIGEQLLQGSREARTVEAVANLFEDQFKD